MIKRLLLSAALVPALASAAGAAITFGQIDDFQSGDTMGWSQGGPSPNVPSVIPTGGPAGIDDKYLQNISSGGFGPGSKQVMMNMTQWAGNYTMAGVTRITAELANFGSKPLSMRVVLEGGPGSSSFVSTNAFPLPTDKFWHAATFELTAAALEPVEGSDSLTDVLGSVTSLRIISAQMAGSRGDAIAATLGADDIRALTLPGDANHDSVVNFSDLLILAQHYNAKGVTWDQGDFNFDGSVGFDDLLLLAQDYGQKVSTAGGAVAAAVPEPAAALPLALAMAGLTRRRRTH